MEAYQKKIKHRIYLCRGWIAVCAAAVLILGELSGRGILLGGQTRTDFAVRYASALLFGEIIACIFLIRQNRLLLKNREKAQQQRRTESDELRCLIHDKSGGFVTDCLAFLFSNGAIILSFVDMAAFYTAVSALAAVLFFKTAAHLFYRRKFGL